MFDIKEIATAGMILFAVIDIVGGLPIVISLRNKVGHIQSEKASFIAGILMIAFLRASLSLTGINGFAPLNLSIYISCFIRSLLTLLYK